MYIVDELTKYFYGMMKNPVVFSSSLVELWVNVLFYPSCSQDCLRALK